MRFDLSEDQKLLRDATEDFLSSESPVAVSRGVSETTEEGYSTEHWTKLAELGYLGLVAPESAGGQALGAVELAVVCEAMGRVCFPGPYLDVVLAGAVLAGAAGTSEHADALLAELVAGTSLVVLGGQGSVWPGRTAECSFKDGRVRGIRYFVPFGAAADRLIVETDEGTVLAEGPFETRAMPTLDEAVRYAEVTLDNPATLLAPPGATGIVDDLAAVAAAAKALGVSDAVLRAGVEYAKTRETFGKPIGVYQVLQHRLADMLMRTEASRSAVYRAAWSVAAGIENASLLAAAAKAYATESATAVTRECIQVHGGNGFTWEYDLHRYLKLAMTLDQHYGAADAMLDRALAATRAA